MNIFVDYIFNTVLLPTIRGTYLLKNSALYAEHGKGMLDVQVDLDTELLDIHYKVLSDKDTQTTPPDLLDLREMLDTYDPTKELIVCVSFVGNADNEKVYLYCVPIKYVD